MHRIHGTLTAFLKIIKEKWGKKWLLLKPGSGPWTRTLNKLDHKKTWTLKNMDSEKQGTTMGLKNMPDFREFCFKKIVRNVIFYFKVHRYLNFSD